MDAPPGHLGEDVGGVSEQADRDAAAGGGVAADARERIVEIVRHLVQVARLDPALDPVRVDLDVQAGGARERGGQWLRAAHPAQARREHGAAGQIG